MKCFPPQPFSQLLGLRQLPPRRVFRISLVVAQVPGYIVSVGRENDAGYLGCERSPDYLLPTIR